MWTHKQDLKEVQLKAINRLVGKSSNQRLTMGNRGKLSRQGAGSQAKTGNRLWSGTGSQETATGLLRLGCTLDDLANDWRKKADIYSDIYS